MHTITVPQKTPEWKPDDILIIHVRRTTPKAFHEKILRMCLSDKKGVAPVAAVERHEYYALPRDENSLRFRASEGLDVDKLKSGTVYDIEAACKIVQDYIETARKCECGLLRAYGMQRCYQCTYEYKVKYFPKDFTPYVYEFKRRTLDHRELEHETKRGRGT